MKCGALCIGMKLFRNVLFRMFGRPSGLLGRVGARLMSRINADVAAAVVDELDVAPTDAVLEVGFGPGVGIERAAAAATDGFVAGVDYSETMVERAVRRNETAIEEGRVDLRYGSATDLPFEDASFDEAFSINSIHVWPNPRAGLTEIYRVLKPGGTVAITLTDHAGQTDEPVGRLLRESGFETVRRTGPTETLLATRPD